MKKIATIFIFVGLTILGADVWTAEAGPLVQCDFKNGISDEANDACVHDIEVGSGGPNVVVNIGHEGIPPFPGDASPFALRFKIRGDGSSNTSEMLWSKTCTTLNGIPQPCGSSKLPKELWAGLYFYPGTALPTSNNGIKWWTIASTESGENNVIHLKVVHDPSDNSKMEVNIRKRGTTGNAFTQTPACSIDKNKWHYIAYHIKIGAQAGQSRFEVWCDRNPNTELPNTVIKDDIFVPGATLYEDQNLKGVLMWNQRNSPHPSPKEVYWYGKGFCASTDSHTCANWLDMDFNSTPKLKDQDAPAKPIGLKVR